MKWPYHRLKGLRPIRRNDVVVFNFPAGDTVLLENQAVTYYDVLRSYEESFGREEGRRQLNEKYTVISRPVDKRENYIKRCVALPGDSLAIRDGRVYVNGTAQEPIAGIQYTYLVQTSAPFSQYAIDNLGVTEYSGNGSSYYMSLTAEAPGRSRRSRTSSRSAATSTPQRRRLPAVGRRPLESGQLRPDLDPEAGGHGAAHDGEPAPLPPHHRGLRRP